MCKNHLFFCQCCPSRISIIHNIKLVYILGFVSLSMCLQDHRAAAAAVMYIYLCGYSMIHAFILVPFLWAHLGTILLLLSYCKKPEYLINMR